MPSPVPFERPIRLREVRLITGLILATFLLTHLSNHALGLLSLGAMEWGRRWFGLIWRSPLGTVALFGAVLIHYVLGLQALYRRRTLRMPVREAAQLSFGLVLPFLLIPHVSGTRLDFWLTGHDPNYRDVLQTLWAQSSFIVLRQSFALAIAWTHACLGIYFWLRYREWFSRKALLLYTGAILIPLLALLGFAEAGRAVAQMPPPPDRPTAASVAAVQTSLYVGFGAMLAAAVLLRAGRIMWNWSTRISIAYPGGRVVTVPTGFSVLEASRRAGIAHASVCGGRGRCSTCRIRVSEGLDGQPAPNAQERATLARIKAGGDVRLACQFRPTGDLSVVPLVLTGHTQSARLPSRLRGQERQVAVLFCDLRGFTTFAENRLPFDTVFILNRYFELVGEAVRHAGGHLDKFVGDGALALFGLDEAPDVASGQAVEAAKRIRIGLDTLNREFAGEIERPFRIAMGLHVGSAIVGEMGYGAATSLTAVGDTINTASRLESLAKELDAELVLSDEVVKRAELDVAAMDRKTLALRGRAAPITAWIVPSVDDLKS
jgi:adenylate cyclase